MWKYGLASDTKENHEIFSKKNLTNQYTVQYNHIFNKTLITIKQGLIDQSELNLNLLMVDDFSNLHNTNLVKHIYFFNKLVMSQFQESPGIQKQSAGMHIFQVTLPDQIDST